jgi:hypothetical protein
MEYNLIRQIISIFSPVAPLKRAAPKTQATPALWACTRLCRREILMASSLDCETCCPSTRTGPVSCQPEHARIPSVYRLVAEKTEIPKALHSSSTLS